VTNDNGTANPSRAPAVTPGFHILPHLKVMAFNQEKLKDTKVVMRIRKSKDTIKGQKNPKTMIYKTLHRKLTIKHHEPHKNRG
jgi:hypothetical protein